ncbi:hypothetical protein NPX13_g5572 [Xylaria arbuscula]|uniref:Uncharacterized protein n=1 Tax=Xylaria arbuscula TaxID=114810 RepID=A0A9W8NE45_9PEZI|nr:hypothetical protein NPX13_g5572 [Xylaria arbuscula]
MFSPLVNWINDVALGPEKRKVKQYLGAATRGWTEECFHNHIRSSYWDATISDAAVRLLWRSFYFYARHPFPTLIERSQEAALDFESFKRAVLLTVFQTDGLLGTVELDWYWREDAAFFHKASIARMFSSFSLPLIPCGPQEHTEAPVLSDIMDVLVMTGPQFIHAVPSKDQLEPVAQRLFAEGGSKVTRVQTVRRDDFDTFMDFLLRLRLMERRWGLSYPFGDFVEASCEHHGVTKTMVELLAGSNGDEEIHIQKILKVIDMLPNLPLRFQQLWAVLFQPKDLANMAMLPT